MNYKLHMVAKFFYFTLAIFFLLLFLELNGIAQSTKSAALSWPADSFSVVHSVDFEDNTPGVIADNPSEWEDDWNEPWHYFAGCWITRIIQKGSTKCMEINFGEGTDGGIEPQGVDFTVDIPGVEADSVELYLSYDVMFRPGFDFVISGKTGGHMNVGQDWAGEPGHIGNGPEFDQGGRFGLSWMNNPWIPAGGMWFYFYHFDWDGTSGDAKPWYSPTDPNGRVYFYPTEEIWYNITIRMVCNTVNDWENGEIGNNDGYAEGFINGRFMTRWDNLRMRNVDTIGINQLVIFSQFGGSGEEFSPKRDEWLLTDNYYIWTYAQSVTSAPKKYERSDSNRILHIPQSWTNASLINEDTPDDVVAPSVPSGLNITNITSNSFDIKWNASTDNIAVTGYNIYLNRIKAGTSAGTSYTFSNLDTETEYTIKVSAYDKAGNESAKSDPKQIVLTSFVPATPSELDSRDITDSSVTLFWVDNSSNEQGYVIERSFISSIDFKIIDTLNTNTSTYINNNLKPNSIYYYRIYAYNSIGNSAYSNRLSVRMRVANDLNAPTGLNIISKSTNQLTFGWTDNSTSETAFIIKRALYPYENYEIIYTSDPNETTYTDNNVIPNTTYLYLVSAVNEDGESKNSNKLRVSTVSMAESQRVQEDLIAFYNFSLNTNDSIVHDYSNYDNSLNLIIPNTTNISWKSNSRLEIINGTIIHSIEPATKIVKACKETNEITLECWIKPSAYNATDDAKIVSLSKDGDNIGVSFIQRFLSLTKSDANFEFLFGLSTKSTESNGKPYLATNGENFNISLYHLVYTKNNIAEEKIYLNNKLIAEGFKPLSFENWDNQFYLSLGNESTLDQPWKGTFYLLALYKKALNAEQISQNYQAGPNDFVQLLKNNFEVKFSPNPSNGIFTVNIKPLISYDICENIIIQVVNINGIILYEQILRNSDLGLDIPMNLSSLPKSIYQLRLITSDNIDSYKFIIM